MSGWKIVGITDESTTCEVCGRVELKSTVVLELEDGSRLYAGSSCAARKVGVKAADMRSSVKAYRNRLEAARCDFPSYFRGLFGKTLEQYLREFPEHRAVPEGMYRRFMLKRGFDIAA
jgi:hypothetical protein